MPGRVDSSDAIYIVPIWMSLAGTALTDLERERAPRRCASRLLDRRTNCPIDRENGPAITNGEILEIADDARIVVAATGTVIAIGGSTRHV